MVPAHNSADGIAGLLDALAGQTLARGRFEVIVADDASTDATADIVRAHGLARVVTLAENGGSYSARNRALEETAAGIIAFTDDDCRPDATWLERGLARFADPGVDVVAGHIEVELGPDPSSAALVDFARSLDQERCATKEDFGATANLWVRRSVLDEVGVFNARLISGGDTEFGHRATRAGHKVHYASDVIVRHGSRSRPRQLARKAHRLGYGAAQHRVHADGPLQDRSLIWVHPGAYLLRVKPAYGVERIARAGIPLTRLRHARLRLVEYLFVQLPLVAGSFAGWRHERRGRLR